MKKVSIITVTYNVSKAILPTLESVKQIKTPDIEYIITLCGEEFPKSW